MRQAISDIVATVGVALMLGGVNEHNPYQYLCMAGAALLCVASYFIGRKQ